MSPITPPYSPRTLEIKMDQMEKEHSEYMESIEKEFQSFYTNEDTKNVSNKTEPNISENQRD